MSRKSALIAMQTISGIIAATSERLAGFRDDDLHQPPGLTAFLL